MLMRDIIHHLHFILKKRIVDKENVEFIYKSI